MEWLGEIVLFLLLTSIVCTVVAPPAFWEDATHLLLKHLEDWHQLASKYDDPMHHHHLHHPRGGRRKSTTV
jgi:hypothetical protein